MPRTTEAVPIYISLQEAAVRLSLSVDMLRDEIARGHLPAYRVGNGRGRLRVRIADLDALMRPVVTVGTL